MPNQPHDKFFKALFSDKSMATEYLTQFMPPNLVSRFNLEELQLQKGSFVDEMLKESYSDIVYTCPFGNSGNAIQISLLLEHKSFPSKHPHIQLLRYMLNAWEHQIKNNEQLKPIIPIIFYHGREKWENIRLSAYFKEFDDLLLPFLPQFDYLLTDLKEYPDEKILTLRKSFFINSLLVLKHAWDRNYLNKNFTLLIEPNNGIEGNLKRSFFVYFISVSKLTNQEIVDKMNSLSDQNQGEFKSTYDMLIEKGIEKGLKVKEKQAIKGLLLNGVSDDLIAKSLNVDLEKIFQIKQELGLD